MNLRWETGNKIRRRSFTAPTKREIMQFLPRSRAVAAKKCSRNCAELLLFPPLHSMANLLCIILGVPRVSKV